MKWISIENKKLLPEPGTTVLVCGTGFFNDYEASIQRWERTIDPALPKEKPHWFGTREFEPYENFKITHWMPLPEAPKKKKIIKVKSKKTK